MLLARLVEASRQVGATRSRLEKVDLLATVIRDLRSSLVSIGVSYLAGDLPQGRLGVGFAVLRELHGGGAAPAAAVTPSLQIAEVHATFSAIKSEGGGGSASRRAALLRQLLARASGDEQNFLFRLIVGELRQGALEGIVIDAVARAFGIAAARVRRATMLAGALPAVAEALAREGEAGLSGFDLTLFQPVQPMLADSAEDVGEALERLGARSSFEYKLDGARVQVHKDGDHVEIYSRQLNRVTAAVPEIVELVAALPARRLILDGEAIALSPERRPLPFQLTMRRFGRKLDVAQLREELPIAVSFFDALRVDDQVLLDLPLDARWQALNTATAGRAMVPRVVTDSLPEAQAFLARALGDGHEGVMAKSLTAGYSAGRRGQEWLKLKAVHTLDLVVLAAEWGSGRRRGWLSNLHLGARDPDQGGFVMLGKTFKGMTDELLRWQTEALLARELGREGEGEDKGKGKGKGMTVHVRPELVVEVAFNDVQQSSQYPGGVALRFARLKRYRPDKPVSEASTIGEVRALLPHFPS